MVKSKTCRDAEILVRNLSPRLFGEKFWDSKKKKTMKKWDFKTYQKRFRDFEILPKFSKTHIPFATPIILINDMHIFAFPLYPYYLKWWGWRKGTLIWRRGGCFLILWPRRWVLIRALLRTRGNTVYPPHPSLSDSINLATSVLPLPCFQQNVRWKCSFNIITLITVFCFFFCQFCILESFEWIKEWNSPGWKGLSRLQLYCSLW